MDRVRFGRALGYGARHAAKTLAEAAKAASSTSSTPSPAGTQTARSTANPINTSGTPPQGPRANPVQEVGSRVMEAHRAVSSAKARAQTEATSAGRAILGPVRRAGGVLWLEMTGSVFALFALFLAPGVWKLRTAVHAPASSAEAHKFYLYLLVLALFAYFAISSFVRAHRRGKRP